MAPMSTVEILKTSLQLTATPREAEKRERERKREKETDRDRQRDTGKGRDKGQGTSDRGRGGEGRGGEERGERTEERGEREERERVCVWFGEHLLHQTPCIKPFVLLLIRCPHGTVLLDTIGLDHMGVGMDVDVAVSVEKSEIRSTTNGAARRAALGLGVGMQTLCECHARDCGVAAGENRSPGKDVGLYGQRRAFFSWQESCGERTRTTSEEAQRPEEHDEAELDQQGVQTRRGGEREVCGDAGE